MRNSHEILRFYASALLSLFTRGGRGRGDIMTKHKMMKKNQKLNV